MGYAERKCRGFFEIVRLARSQKQLILNCREFSFWNGGAPLANAQDLSRQKTSVSPMLFSLPDSRSQLAKLVRRLLRFGVETRSVWAEESGFEL
jgi:hypothetical protein